MTWDGRRVRRNAPMALAVVVLLAVSLNCASRTGERRYTREALDRDCRGGDGEACEILASSFLEGKGVEKDVNLAYGYLYDACALDRAHACYRVGAHLRHHAKKNPELRPRARELLEKACALDDATACDHIGADLYNGNGVFTADEKDVAAARGHFERQCGRRYLQSCVNLATSFRENGSLTRAFVASERACALGSTDQCALVGRLKVRGEGTPRDVAAGLRMLGERCFDRDEAMACEELGLLYAFENPGLLEADDLAAALYRRACEDLSPSLASSCSIYARRLVKGRYVRTDLARGRAIFERLCLEDGDAEACAARNALDLDDDAMRLDAALRMTRDCVAHGDEDACREIVDETGNRAGAIDAFAPHVRFAAAERVLSSSRRLCNMDREIGCTRLGRIFYSSEGRVGTCADAARALPKCEYFECDGFLGPFTDDGPCRGTLSDEQVVAFAGDLCAPGRPVSCTIWRRSRPPPSTETPPSAANPLAAATPPDDAATPSMTTCADPADDVCAVPKPAVPDTGRITDEVLDIVGEHCRRAGLASCTSDFTRAMHGDVVARMRLQQQCARGVSAACSRLVQMDDRREEQTLTPKERIAALLTWCDPTDRDANADACAQVVGHEAATAADIERAAQIAHASLVDAEPWARTHPANKIAWNLATRGALHEAAAFMALIDDDESASFPHILDTVALVAFLCGDRERGVQKMTAAVALEPGGDGRDEFRARLAAMERNDVEGVWATVKKRPPVALSSGSVPQGKCPALDETASAER